VFLIGVPRRVLAYIATLPIVPLTNTYTADAIVIVVVSAFDYQEECLDWAGKHVRRHHTCDKMPTILIMLFNNDASRPFAVGS
jgi:hypothetical protein